MDTTASTLSGIVSQFLDEGAELMAGLSDEDDAKREAAAFALPNWLGRFQIESGKAIRSQKLKRKA
ncbi:MAG: hypothetical protein QM706_08770 [Nitrospira sp.]